MHVYTRAEWGAAPARRFHPQTPDASGTVYIHHTESPAGVSAKATFEAECRMMRDIQAYHQKVHGWDDIGYSYVVFPSGRAYKARGFHQVTAAELNHNAGNGAICLVGNFDREKPTWAARRSAVRLARRFPGRTMAGHRDVNSTRCPGDNLYSALPRMRFWARKAKP